MPDELLQTGNPVFDYRAKFRARAYWVQRKLMGLGVLGALGGAALLLFSSRMMAALACMGTGLLLLASGIVWGFHWRKKLRAEFAQKYK